MKELTTALLQASSLADPILDFENLDFKIASGVNKILTRNVKKQVTTAKGKSSIREEIAYRQTDCLNDLRVLQKQVRQFSRLGLQRRNECSTKKSDNFQACNTKWDDVLSAVTDSPTDNILESLCKVQVEKSKELNNCCISTLKRLQLLTRNTIIAD